MFYQNNNITNCSTYLQCDIIQWLIIETEEGCIEPEAGNICLDCQDIDFLGLLNSIIRDIRHEARIGSKIILTLLVQDNRIHSANKRNFT